MMERRRWMAGDSLRGNGREDGFPMTNVENDLVEEDGGPIPHVGHVHEEGCLTNNLPE
jgi:hypothetical protein